MVCMIKSIYGRFFGTTVELGWHTHSRRKKQKRSADIDKQMDKISNNARYSL